VPRRFWCAKIGFAHQSFQSLPKFAQKLAPSPITLVDVSGKDLDTKGCVTLEIDFEGHKLLQQFIIAADINEDMILGIDAILKHGIVIDGSVGKVYIKNQGRKKGIASFRETYDPTLKISSTTIIPPKSFSQFTAKRTAKRFAPIGEDFIFTPTQSLPKGIRMNDALYSRVHKYLYQHFGAIPLLF